MNIMHTPLATHIITYTINHIITHTQSHTVIHSHSYIPAYLGTNTSNKYMSLVLFHCYVNEHRAHPNSSHHSHHHSYHHTHTITHSHTQSLIHTRISRY